MKISLVIVYLVLTLSVLKAQSKTDSIFIQKLGVNSKFIQNKKVLNTKDVLLVMESNQDAYRAMKNAKIYSLAAYPLVIVGIGMFAFPVYNKVVNDVADIRLLVGGLGLGMLAGLASTTGKNKARYAVYLFNEGVNQSSQRNVNLDFGLNANGLGITLRF